MTTNTDIFRPLITPPMTKEQAREMLRDPRISEIQFPAKRDVDWEYKCAIERGVKDIDGYLRQELRICISGPALWVWKPFEDALEELKHELDNHRFSRRDVHIQNRGSGHFACWLDNYRIADIKRYRPSNPPRYLITTEVGRVHGWLSGALDHVRYDYPDHQSSFLEQYESGKLTLGLAKKMVQQMIEKSKLIDLIVHLRNTGPMSGWCQFFPMP